MVIDVTDVTDSKQDLERAWAMAMLARTPDEDDVRLARKNWRAQARSRRLRSLKRDYVEEAVNEDGTGSWARRWKGHYIDGAAPGVV